MKTIVENARFTFLTESLVRIEYSPDKVFNDDETLFAKTERTVRKKYTVLKTEIGMSLKPSFLSLRI